jgi:hypothetical protein
MQGVFTRWAIGCVASATLGCVSGVPSSELPDPPSSMRDASIELSMSPCYGRCPAFSMTLSGGGALHWEGRRNVAAIGERNTVVSPAAVEAILKKLDTQFELWLTRNRSKTCPAQFAAPGTVCAVGSVPIDSSYTLLTVRHTGGSLVVGHGFLAPRELSPFETALLGLVADWLWP